MAGRRVLQLGAAAVCLATSACVQQPATEQGRGAKDLYDLFTVIAAVIFVIVAGLIGFSILRFRKKRGDETLPEQFHTNTKLEILWFAIPQLIVIGLFVGSVMVLNDTDRVRDETDVTVNVTSFQWGWRFSYEGTTVTIESLPDSQAEIFVPVGETVAFNLESEDVIHSFYVPKFFVKRDVVPGRTNRLEVVIEEPGTYTGRCAEFCGLLHDRMDFKVTALEPAAFDEWLASND
ncbi:MAG: cytochrome c oxidase subunit [Actinomycetota bacterium]|jgi:cytochrome c oxidase subunit 2|nr:cytochrome c oxidase subunit [Actinomycetota bacterium]